MTPLRRRRLLLARLTGLVAAAVAASAPVAATGAPYEPVELPHVMVLHDDAARYLGSDGGAGSDQPGCLRLDARLGAAGRGHRLRAAHGPARPLALMRRPRVPG